MSDAEVPGTEAALGEEAFIAHNEWLSAYMDSKSLTHGGPDTIRVCDPRRAGNAIGCMTRDPGSYGLMEGKKDSDSETKCLLSR